MNIKSFAFAVFALGASVSVSAIAQTAAPDAASSASSSASASCVADKLSSDSTVGDLLDNPAAKAILIKHVPELANNDQIEQARPMSLRSLQTYAPDTFTDKVLADIDTDLAAIPVCQK